MQGRVCFCSFKAWSFGTWYLHPKAADGDPAVLTGVAGEVAAARATAAGEHCGVQPTAWHASAAGERPAAGQTRGDEHGGDSLACAGGGQPGG